jgi:hypothetical protein
LPHLPLSLCFPVSLSKRSDADPGALLSLNLRERSLASFQQMDVGASGN